MKISLLLKTKIYKLQANLPLNAEALIQDLSLNTLWKSMSQEDEFLWDVVKDVTLSAMSNDIPTILYRQDILKDCLQNPTVIHKLYTLTIEGIEIEKRWWYSSFRGHPSYTLSGFVEKVKDFVEVLKKLKNIADEQSHQFNSQGFTQFFTMLQTELTDTYFASIEDCLTKLETYTGILIGVELGKGNKGNHYLLRKLQYKKMRWWEWLFTPKRSDYSFSIDPRDESGNKALTELKDAGLNLISNSLMQSIDHILSFFHDSKTELAFYLGCLNLDKQLKQLKAPTTFPTPEAYHKRSHKFQGLYDVCLALNKKQSIVGNEMKAPQKNLIIITGANQGGKSTFLRSIGLSQLMMQAGMFVSAESFSANICDTLFTHYKREEDITMESGKFDEELSRMREIIDHITTNSLILFNESFSATNEKEGSEIARNITSALWEKEIKVFFVTHLYDFALSFYDKKKDTILFLRAEREMDGNRTFKLKEGKPLQTSYGGDLYKRIFSP